MTLAAAPQFGILRRTPLFADLSDAELSALCPVSSSHDYLPRELVFREGELCRELWIVGSGTVRVYKTAVSGRQQLLAMERAGSSLSEIPVFDGGPHPATAEALEQTTMIRVDAVRFREACARQPDLAVKISKVLAHRLRRMGSLIEDLSFSTVRGRLIARLLQLAAEGVPEGEGVSFDLRENNEELAARLGTVRELVSRNLGRLHNDGWITIRRRRVTIHRVEALREELSSA